MCGKMHHAIVSQFPALAEPLDVALACGFSKPDLALRYPEALGHAPQLECRFRQRAKRTHFCEHRLLTGSFPIDAVNAATAHLAALPRGSFLRSSLYRRARLHHCRPSAAAIALQRRIAVSQVGLLTRTCLGKLTQRLEARHRRQNSQGLPSAEPGYSPVTCKTLRESRRRLVRHQHLERQARQRA